MAHLTKDKIAYAILLATIWSFAVPSWAVVPPSTRELCESHVKVLQKGREAAIPLDALMAVASDHDLIFIGESHFEESSRLLYRTMLKSLIGYDPRFNCVFIENSPETDGSKNLEKCNEDRSLLNANNFSSEKVSACEAGSSMWKGLENEAFQNGMRVYAIDSFESCKKSGGESAVLVNNCRDEFMRASIQNWIDAGKCDKGLVVNGFPHVTSITAGHLPLAHRSFRTATGNEASLFRINFMFSGYDQKDNIFDPRWRWADWKNTVKGPRPQLLICGGDPQPSPITQPYAFLNSVLGMEYHPYTWMDGRPVGDWMDFEATVIAGKDLVKEKEKN